MGETDDLEWDDDKDAANRRKHGLPLDFASLVFDGRPRYERGSPKQVVGEFRIEAMAEIADRVIFCVFIWRGFRRRVMSVRNASRSERRAYKEATRGR
ncbi:MAG TPA: BrnT family toxin [Ancylobacter sp.]